MKPAPPTQRTRRKNSRMLGGQFNKQWNLPMRLVLGTIRWVDHHICPPESSKFNRGFTWGFTYSSSMFSTTPVSQGCIFGAASSAEKASGRHLPNTGEGQGASDCLGPAHRSTSGHVLPMTSSNKAQTNVINMQ